MRRHDVDVLGDRVRAFDGRHDVGTLDLHVADRLAESLRRPGRSREFDLETDASATQRDDDVQFCARRGPVERDVGTRRRRRDDLLDDETLPRCAGRGVALQIGHRTDVEQRMQDAGVAQIDLRRLDEPLADGRVPGSTRRTIIVSTSTST